MLDQIQNILAIVGGVAIALPAVMSALIALSMAIPGEQPDKALQKAADWVQKAVDVIKKFSKK